ncbi:MAG: UDP-N-acetylglucosamine 1-carboxyvinyltransferase [Firmicutes bacterium]|nr:UDP-N-acetylglucosamine 1-carboxyvinyltransferase [Bacillota bacterium]
MKLYIKGGEPLFGTVKIDSSKNALLPIIAGTILTSGVTVIRNVPRISDIDNLLKILVMLDIKPAFKDGDLWIDTTDIKYNDISGDTAKKIRGSIFVLGAIIGRFGRASIPYPGGCAIGSRPVDMHLSGFQDLGIKVTEKNDVINCQRAVGPNRSARRDGTFYVDLDFPSVGATENFILASVIGKNRVQIRNAAREPEVEALCNFLISCGARICGVGTSTITIHGVKTLNATDHTTIPDRINTGSMLCAVAACGGDVTLENVIPEHNRSLISKLVKCGYDITVGANTIRIIAVRRPKAIPSTHTSVYPGFPTDTQSQFAVVMSIARGSSSITENMFENRFQYAPHLRKLGAQTFEQGKNLNIRGVTSLRASDDETKPTELTASDLRGGVALVIAALSAEGASVIHNAEYVYRGHANIDGDFIKLGGNITRIDN